MKTLRPRLAALRSFTIIETVVAMGIMAVVMMAMLAAQFSGSQLRTNTRQIEYITGKVQTYFGELRQKNSSSEVVALVPVAPLVWIPAGDQTPNASTAGGNDVVSNGVFVTGSTAVVLTEAQCAATFGGTFDLNRDGTFDDATPDPDPGANYETVIPVRFTVTWSNRLVGPGNTRTMTFNTIIYPIGNLQ
ncbi:MAG: hypothetical protein JKY65_14155 [Planctomycetes bacterium]|nr:hypothetical protein [Planctomycetota bacterium]